MIRLFVAILNTIVTILEHVATTVNYSPRTLGLK
jgi:hypothetical protein